MVDPVVVVMSVRSEECEVVEIGDDVSGEVLMTCGALFNCQLLLNMSRFNVLCWHITHCEF